jgi:hypothetical protein
MEASYLPQDRNGERQDSNGEGHLSDEQFTELLLGGRPAWVQVHLQECAACREEAARVGGAIGDFSEQSRLWAERRAAAQLMPVRERRSAALWLVRPQAWVGGALTIALAVGVGLTLQREHTRRAHDAVATVQADSKVQAGATVQAATLKSDNALLTAIDGELRADESTPASLYGLEADTSGTGTKLAKRSTN